MPQLLAIAPYPFRSADTRYRIFQFKPYLEAAGWKVTVRSFMDDSFFRMYHLPGQNIRKFAYLLRSTLERLKDLATASRYDVLLLHKEAFPFGPPLMETILSRQAPHAIYDMDDAFWTHPRQLKQIGSRLRDPERISKMLRMVDLVLAGNEFLASFARQHNACVRVFPTVVDTNRYCPRPEHQDDIVTIGWVGRWTSTPYLQALDSVVERLGAMHSNVELLLIGADATRFSGVPVKTHPWRLETEIEDVARIDVGIMPLPDDTYARGKCGLKLLQYMALGIPSVASPMGVSKTIIQDGFNGFLADSDDEWVEKLTRLIVDNRLREKLGKAGRKTVESYFSVERAGPELLEILSTR